MKESHCKTFMRMAYNMAKNSYCNRLQVGCIIVTTSGLLSVGYNGTAPGRPNVCETINGKETLDEVRHAEKNAFSKFTRSPETCIGATMFVTHACCFLCALDIVESGVSTVYYSEIYRSTDGIEYLQNNGVKVIHLPLSSCND